MCACVRACVRVWGGLSYYAVELRAAPWRGRGQRKGHTVPECFTSKKFVSSEIVAALADALPEFSTSRNTSVIIASRSGRVGSAGSPTGLPAPAASATPPAGPLPDPWLPARSAPEPSGSAWSVWLWSGSQQPRTVERPKHQARQKASMRADGWTGSCGCRRKVPASSESSTCRAARFDERHWERWGGGRASTQRSGGYRWDEDQKGMQVLDTTARRE